MKKLKFKPIKNSKGQALMEYMIITALVAVSSIGIVGYISHVVKTKGAQIAAELRDGDGKAAKAMKFDRLDQKYYKKRSMGDFFEGND